MTEFAEAGSVEPRVVQAGRGVSWWSEAWALFVKAPGMWIVFGLVLIAVFVVLGFIPVVGTLASALLAPVLAGGWMLASRKVEGGGTLEVADLFAGFKERLNPLLVLGALTLVATFALGALAAAMGFGAVMGMIAGGAHGSAAGAIAALGAGMFSLLVFLALGLLMTMALWFAPPLVVLRNVAPVDALKASFAASLKNVMPFLVYSVLYIVAAIVASIPVGLGWIVLVPVLLLSVYVSYQDVFGA